MTSWNKEAGRVSYETTSRNVQIVFSDSLNEEGESMLKKSWLIGLLLMCMGGLLGSKAYGGYPGFVFGTGGYIRSLCVWSEWKFIANSTNLPTQADYTVSNLLVKSHWFNPAGQDGGEGVFYSNVNLTGSEYVNDATPNRNGVWTSEVCWTNDELFNNVDWSAVGDPPNDKWTLDSASLSLVGYHIRINGYSDINGDGVINVVDKSSTLNPTTFIEGDCTLSSDNLNFTCVITDNYYSGKLKK